MPSLTGTTELTIHVINVNDKKPFFTPPVQRAEVSADADVGSVVHTLLAVDPDITDNGLLVYELLQDRIIKAVDKNGKEVRIENLRFFFICNECFYNSLEKRCISKNFCKPKKTKIAK
jgi:hypothetical protein